MMKTSTTLNQDVKESAIELVKFFTEKGFTTAQAKARTFKALSRGSEKSPELKEEVAKLKSFIKGL